jgi:hypothetical protein
VEIVVMRTRMRMRMMRMMMMPKTREQRVYLETLQPVSLVAL